MSVISGGGRREEPGSLYGVARSGAECGACFNFESAPGHLIRRAQQTHNAVWAAVVGEDLTSPQFAVLSVLFENPGIDQTSLSAGASLDTSTCQDIVARLRQRGLIERSRDPKDGRRWILRLSQKGCDTWNQVTPKVKAVGDVLLGSLNDSEKAEFSRLLSQVAAGDV